MRALTAMMNNDGMNRIRLLFRSLLAATMTLTALGVIGVVQPARPVSAAGEQLFEGSPVYSTIVNCVSIIQGAPYTEAGVGGFVGFYANPDAGEPRVNQVFYLEVHIAGLGNSCGGQRASVELLLPAGVAPAISATNPIRCFAGNTAVGNSECVQSLQVSPYTSGALWYPSVDNAHANTWPLPQGGSWTFRFPVTSTSTLSGVNFGGRFRVLDGWDNPVLQAVQPLYVFNGVDPTVVYPSPSTTFAQVPNSGNFTVRSSSYIYKPTAQTGNAVFELSTSSTFATILFSDPGAIPSGLAALEFFTDWTPFAIAPNTTYFWRVKYTPSGGSTITGATQSFRTPSTGNNVVGNGTAASCTIEALEAAFNPYTERVEFDCGPQPVSFQLRDSYVTGGPLEIDGKGKVTLIAQAGQRIFRHDGGQLNLRGITLKGGHPANACGGALQVLNGTASLYNVRLIDSSAEYGGGLCVMGGTVVGLYDSFVGGNSSMVQGGGVYVGGTLELWRSDVSGNTTVLNGGGVYTSTEGYTDLITSSVTRNTVTSPTGSGGGLFNAFNAVTSIGTSTISTNSAANGGGLMNEGDAFSTASTIAFNTATVGGAGYQSTRAVALRNTLLANNSPSNCISSQRVKLDRGNNLDSDGSCELNEIGDISNVNAKLRPLDNNGGGTPTHALLAGSPAIDAADNVYCGFWDQRGVSGPPTPGDASTRPIDGNGDGVLTCDIGAYELEPAPDYVPVTQVRVMESRPANGTTNPTTGISTNTLLTVDGESQNLGVLAGGSTTRLRIGGRAGVPFGALAASLNVAGTGAAAAGFVRLFPCGQAMPTVATVNVAAATTASNAAISALGEDGSVCIFVSQTMHVIVDINGYFPASSRVAPIRPARIMDTRPTGATDDGIAQRTGLLQPNVARAVPVRGRLGVSNQATGVVVNVTALNAPANAFVTLFPCGTSTPSTSNINLGVGGAVGNVAVVPLPASGELCVVSNQALNVIIDATASLPSSSSFRAITPGRLLDSRPGSATPADDGVNTVRPAGSTTEVVVPNRGGVNGTVTSVVVNVTAVAPAGNGFITVFPCNATRPTTANLNYVSGVTRGNVTVVAVPTTGPKAGRICVYTSQQTNVIVDTQGQLG